MSQNRIFTPYQVFLIAILAFIQFTIVLDFMVLSPLGAILMPQLHISTSQFGLVVSAYAFSAGASGLLAAGFADKFDRKDLLLFFYAGFMIGTLLCALANTYPFLLAARIVTGLFGGVISSVCFAIITDIFKMEVRGRVIGFIQMAFGASQVLGIPVGLLLANHFNWHAPFLMIAGVGILAGILMLLVMQPVTEHLKFKSENNPLQHMAIILSNTSYLRAFAATTLMATGGFMLMPFGSTYSINNLGISMSQLTVLYVVVGIGSFITNPLAGKLSDLTGKYQMFVIGSIIATAMVAIYTNLGTTPLWACILLNVVLFAGISARMISASALMSAIPEPQHRGAFMSINSSVQQVSGGVAAAVAGMIVSQSSSGQLLHYPALGIVVMSSILITVVMMYWINQQVQMKRNMAA